MPWSMMSAASSGGVCSSVHLIASTMRERGSERASRTSFEEMLTFSGSPLIRFRPLICMISSRSTGYAEPICILMLSAVRSPMSRLYRFLIKLMIAASNSSPAQRTLWETTIPPSAMTATSEVPPPMSATIQPIGSVVGSPAPIAAAIGSSTIRTGFAPA